MASPPPPTQRNHKGWRSAPDAILLGHRWHPSGSRQGHPRYTGAQTTGRPWVARHQRHKWRSHQNTSPPTNRMCVKLPIEQVKISGFRARLQSVWPLLKGQNSYTKRKTGECIQWKENGSCSKGNSCSFLHTRARG